MEIANIAIFPGVFLLSLFVFVCLRYFMIFMCGQKTRSQPQRRMYVGSRTRNSLSQSEPSIYVTPANYPPPPKYEAMAPPSYEEVVGIHYPNYQAGQFQPIVTPLATALAQNPTRMDSAPPPNATASQSGPSAPEAIAAPPTTLTVTNEQKTTTVTASS